MSVLLIDMMRPHFIAMQSTFVAAILSAALAEPCMAINVVIDYRYDTTGLFNPGTTNGTQARAALTAAAAFYSALIPDSLSAIPFQDPLTPGAFDSPVWRQIITHPGTGLPYVISSAANAGQDGINLNFAQPVANEFRDIQIPVNQWLVYAGGTASGLVGSDGGTGFLSLGSPLTEQIDYRGKSPPAAGQPADYATWGGFVRFDASGATPWQYDHTIPVATGKIDLYSAALHELGHTFGLNAGGGGKNPEWEFRQVGAEWRGTETLAAWKADDPAAPPAATGVPTATNNDFHWLDNQPNVVGVRSFIVGSKILQDAIMDPTLLAGTRRHLTNVDARALRDLGWDVPLSALNVVKRAADFDVNNVVAAADLALWKSAFGVAGATAGDADIDFDTDGADLMEWQRQLGQMSATAAGTAAPEPGALALAIIAAIAMQGRRRFAGHCRPQRRR